MVILGLGSNQGDRLTSLRKTYQLIQKIPNLSIQQVSPVYQSDALLPENAPASWNVVYYNLALRCETTLLPEELLHHIKQIEKQMGRNPGERWGPRIIDIDILAWDNLILNTDKLHIPHQYLYERPFALWPLADLVPRWIHPQLNQTAAELASHWGNKFSGNAPLNTKQIPHRIDVPQLMGILNLTPDSFSDGGNYLDINSAVQHAKHLLASGADIIDIGAESTRPGAQPISADTEWQRLAPVLTELKKLPARFSVDTYHPQTAEKALGLGVDIINDVSGLEDPLMQELLAKNHCGIILMHHLSIPSDKNYVLPLNQPPVPLIHEWAKKKLDHLLKKGFSLDRLMFDPGIGFGKTPEQELEILKNMGNFVDLGVQLLVGHSRKSFLQYLTNVAPEERDLETVILSLQLKNTVDYLRVHNVAAHTRAFKTNTYSIDHTNNKAN